ncbi:hypothetical protein [Chelativorans xinjiangense]|uniref:hypothetical protein n=1 Tax=Chelativorans xinjiangense TaxID=2681485 RepID=UPI00135B575C|nr:hypothetical protein [Chelativorans xinjiangense]
MKKILENLMAGGLDEEHARAVEEYRRVTKKAKLTPFAAKLLAKRFSEWGDPNEAAEIMIEKCWQGFNASWPRDRPRPGAPPSTGHALVDALYARHH